MSPTSALIRRSLADRVLGLLDLDPGDGKGGAGPVPPHEEEEEGLARYIPIKALLPLHQLSMHGWLYARYLMTLLQGRQCVLLCFFNLSSSVVVGDHGDLVTRSNLLQH